MQSITWYYVHEPRYEHVTIGVHKSSETNMEVKVVCFTNLTQELVIKTNPTQEPKAKANFAQ
jgi:outer membrane protein assembly factor BamE (lipoprotein component of BamABCDE complex)